MISILKNKQSKWINLAGVAIFGGLFFILSANVFAQTSLTLSISPTLYDMAAAPGQVWESNLRVVNVNPFDLTLYAEVVNFAPRGEGGDGLFVPIDESETVGRTLAEWITITDDPIIVPREKTIEIPLRVEVPDDASPGGHFAAILVGTKPPQNQTGQSRLQTSQMVTSLFFAKIAGDISESGSIREFATVKTLSGEPEATFSLRFENRGNVHLQPQGDIRIYNMWGQERGVIPINQQSQFGNVLPDSVRKYVFTWKGEWSPADIGRYRASVALAYGTEARQFASAETYFWVLPVKLILGVVLGLIIFFGLVTWFVKLYVRHMLRLAGLTTNFQSTLPNYTLTTKPYVAPKTGVNNRGTKWRFVVRPVAQAWNDLLKLLRQNKSPTLKFKAVINFVMSYYLFFIAIGLILSFIIFCIWYLTLATQNHRSFEVIYVNQDSSVSKSSEDLIYEERYQQNRNQDTLAATKSKIAVVNRSGVPGKGAQAKRQLEDGGYVVTNLDADFSKPQARSVIVANLAHEDTALELSQIFFNVPISLTAEPSDYSIVLYVGSDVFTD